MELEDGDAAAARVAFDGHRAGVAGGFGGGEVLVVAAGDGGEGGEAGGGDGVAGEVVGEAAAVGFARGVHAFRVDAVAVFEVGE